METSENKNIRTIYPRETYYFKNRNYKYARAVQIIFLLILTALLAYTVYAKPQIFKGDKLKLSDYKFSITDGDTIRAEDYRLRMQYIDAPETLQECYTLQGESWSCGIESTEHLSKLVGDGKGVICDIVGQDKYKRNLAICHKGKLNINQQMVADGYALAYVNYGSPYTNDQKVARTKGLGMWSGTFLDPQIYRKQTKEYNQVKKSVDKQTKKYKNTQGKKHVRNKGHSKNRQDL